MISCLDISIKQYTNGLDATITKDVESLNVYVNAVNRLVVNLAMVCTVGKDNYVRVDKEVLWVTPEMIQELLIKSNTSWEII